MAPPAHLPSTTREPLRRRAFAALAALAATLALARAAHAQPAAQSPAVPDEVTAAPPARFEILLPSVRVESPAYSTIARAPSELRGPRDRQALDGLLDDDLRVRRASRLDGVWLGPAPRVPLVVPPRHPRSREAWRAGRATLASLLAVGIGVPGILPPALIAGLTLCANPPGTTVFRTCEEEVMIASAVGLTLGVFAGVHIVGRSMGGNARALPTAIGTVLGALLGTALLYAGRRVGSSDSERGAMVAAAVLPIVGAVVSYELDSRALRTDPADARPLRW